MLNFNSPTDSPDTSFVCVWSSSVDMPGINFYPTGQGIVTSSFVHYFCNRLILYPITPFNYISSVFSLFINIFVFHKSNRIYLVCSRTPLGFLRDLPVFIFAILGIHLIVHVHGSDLPKLFSYPFWGRIILFFYKFSHRIVCPNSLAVDYIRSCLPLVSISHCDNFAPSLNASPALSGVSQAFDSVPLLRLSGSSSPFLRFVWNSNIMSSKGILEVLEAFVRLESEYNYHVELIVLGSLIADSEMGLKELRNRINCYTLYDFIRFIGPVAPDVAEAFLSMSDVCILNTRYPTECQPISLLSAMVLGKVVVCSNNQFVVSAISSYPAVVISDSHSSDSVLTSLVRVCQDYDQLSVLSSSASERASSCYSMDSFIQRIERLVFH